MNVINWLSTVVTTCILMVHGTYVQEFDDSIVEKSKTGQWLIEFYAPWCGHCKKLEPVYESVAKQLISMPITVARVDCTRYSYTASHFSVRGFPTISYINGNTSYTHDGERSEEGIIDFVHRAQGPFVRRLASVGRFNEAKTDHEKNVFFLYVGDEDTDQELYTNYAKTAEEYFLRSYFYKGPKKILPPTIEIRDSPTVVVFKDDDVIEYEGGVSQTGVVESLSEWVNQERFSAFPRASGSLINSMAQTNAYLVMIVLNITADDVRSESIRIRDIVEIAAHQHKAKYRRKFQFLWFDDVEVANDIVMYRLQLPNIIVLDPVTQFYYMPDLDLMEHLTLRTFMSFLDDVLNKKIKPSGGTGFIERLKRLMYEISSFFTSLWLASKILFFIVVGIPSFIVGLLVWSCCFMDSSEEDTELADSDTAAGDEYNEKYDSKAIEDQKDNPVLNNDHEKAE